MGNSNENKSDDAQISKKMSDLLKTLSEKEQEALSKEMNLQKQASELAQESIDLIEEKITKTQDLARIMEGSHRTTEHQLKSISTRQSVINSLQEELYRLHTLDPDKQDKDTDKNIQRLMGEINELKGINSQLDSQVQLKKKGADLLGEQGKKVVDLAKGWMDVAKTGNIYALALKVIADLLTLAVDRFIDLQKEAEDFRKETKLNVDQTKELEDTALKLNQEYQKFGVTLKDAYKASGDLMNNLGNVKVLNNNKQLVETTVLLSKNLGVSSDTGAKFLTQTMALSGVSSKVATSYASYAGNLAKAAGVPLDKLMKDVAEAGEQALSMVRGSTLELIKGAAAAARLGTSLKTLTESSRSMLNFQTSIGDEMEASVLVGKNLNFMESRRLSYAGKFEEAAKATLATIKSTGEFQKMNMFQQEAIAKAAGMSVGEINKMLMMEKELDKMSEKERKEYDDLITKNKENVEVTKDDLLRKAKMQSLLNQLNDTMHSLGNSLSDVFFPVVELLGGIFIPILKVVVEIAKALLLPFKELFGLIRESNSVLQSFNEWINETIEDARKLYESFGNVGKILTNLVLGGAGIITIALFGKAGLSGLMSMIKKPFTFIKDRMKTALGSGAATTATPDASSITSKGKGMGGSDGPGVKKFLTGLAEGLKKMGQDGVLKGAFNLIPASAGLTLMIPGFLGAKLLQTLNGKKLKQSLEGLAEGIKAMGSGKVFIGSAAMILASPGLLLIGAAAIPISIAGAAGGGSAAKKLLTGLSEGISKMGKPEVFKGALGIAAFGLSLLPFTFAMKMFSELDWAQVGIGALALIGFTAAAFGLGALVSGPGGLIFGAGVLAITALGLALIPFGLAALAAGAGMTLFAEGIAKAIDPVLQLTDIDLLKAAIGIGAISVALAAFGAGSAYAGIGSFVGKFLGGDPVKKMRDLAEIGGKLKVTADALMAISKAAQEFQLVNNFSDAISTLAASLEKLNSSVEKLDTSNLNKLGIAKTLENKNAKSDQDKLENKNVKSSQDNTTMIGKLDELINLMKSGGIAVNIDGKRASELLAQASY